VADRKPVVSSHRTAAGVDPDKAAAWGRVTRTMAFAFGLVGGGVLFQDFAFTARMAIAGGLGIGLITYMIMFAIGAARGLGAITGSRDPKNRFRMALGFAVFIGLLGGSGVYFHDGSPLKEALMTGGALGLFGFVIGYFPIIATILSIIGLGSG
jgi:hypothetical protein